MKTNEVHTYLKHRFGSFATRYPAVVHWLAQRLANEQFTGLPLLVLSIGMAVSVVTLSEVAENIVNIEPMVQLDMAFTQWLFQGRTGQLSEIFYGLTWFGSIYVTVGLTLLGSIVLLLYQKKRNVLILWILMAGVGLFVQVGKRQFNRPRPQQVAYYTETGFSFPSGHSATALTLYGLLGYWWIRRLRSIRSRIGVGVGATSLVLLVGFSRIYLGVHFLSDVLGGYLLGICWLIVGIVLTEWQRTSFELRRRF